MLPPALAPQERRFTPRAQRLHDAATRFFAAPRLGPYAADSAAYATHITLDESQHAAVSTPPDYAAARVLRVDAIMAPAQQSAQSTGVKRGRERAV